MSVLQSQQLSDKIQNRLCSLPLYSQCDTLFSFVNYGKEVVTKGIIENALDLGKQVGVPYITGKPHEMVFMKIDGLHSLTENKYGILEPEFKEENILKSDEKTIIIVPGMVFDENKNRMGYGGGYYDKYLSESAYMSSIGICYDFQIIKNVPVEDNDVSLNIVISDRRILK